MKLGKSTYYYDEDLECKLRFKTNIRTIIFLTIESTNRMSLKNNLSDKFNRLFNTSINIK